MKQALEDSKPRKYYMAYNERYKRVHEENLLWFIDEPTHEVSVWIENKQIAFGETICEVGCGEGRDALHLARLGYLVTALDVSEEAILSCTKRAKEYDLSVKWKIEDLAVPCESTDNTFNWIYSVATLHMLTEAEDRLHFLRNLFAMLKCGGSLLLVNKGDGIEEKLSNGRNAFQLVKRTHTETGKELMVPETSFYQTKWATLEGEVTAAGFKIEKTMITENRNYGTCMTLYLAK